MLARARRYWDNLGPRTVLLQLVQIAVIVVAGWRMSAKDLLGAVLVALFIVAFMIAWPLHNVLRRHWAWVARLNWWSIVAFIGFVLATSQGGGQVPPLAYVAILCSASAWFGFFWGAMWWVVSHPSHLTQRGLERALARRSDR